MVYAARAPSLLLLRVTLQLLTCVPAIAVLCSSEFLRSIDFVSQNQGHSTEEAQNYQIIFVRKRNIETRDLVLAAISHQVDVSAWGGLMHLCTLPVNQGV